MNQSEKPQFMTLLSTLFGAHGKPLSESMINGYWKGLEKMTLTGFERCCDEAIGKLQYAERGVSKTPTVAELWDIHRGIRRLPSAPAAKEPEFQGDKWDLAANQLLVHHITQNSRRQHPVDYAPDSGTNGARETHGEQTVAIAKILRHYARQWADMRRADERDGVAGDGKGDWLSLMAQADKVVLGYLEQRRAA